MNTGFHEAYRVENDTRLGGSAGGDGRRRTKAEPVTKTTTEKWGQPGNEFTGRVKRNAETGTVLEVSPRTANGKQITGNAEDVPLKKAAIQEFIVYEKERMAEERREKEAEQFNEAQGMAESTLKKAVSVVRRSEEAAARHVSRISGHSAVDRIQGDAVSRSNMARERFGLPPMVGTGGTSVRHNPATDQVEVHGGVIPQDNSGDELEAVVVGGGKRWESSDWTGTVSDFLKIPYDGVTAPSYAASMPAMTEMPADDGSDERTNALYIQISETPGPVFHVGRA